MNQETHKMNSEEKKDFLSNDLTERMIRVEQRVSAKFGKPVLYNKTEYYKSLAPEQRSKFEKYLKNKKQKKYFWLLLAVPVVLFLLFNARLTGNVIGNGSGGNGMLVFISVIILIGFVFTIFMLNMAIKNKRERRFEEFYGILEKSLRGNKEKR